MALAFQTTGKYVSERHEIAKQKGLITAGQAAAIISRKTGTKISASEIRPFADEWHHSGFYAGKMGKTWFFRSSTVDHLIEMYSSKNPKI